MDVATLARIQFAANISFHILFPAITIGLAWFLVYFRVRYAWSRDDVWDHAYGFWVKVFALSFALGIVSGVTMSFQFGTNWPGFMNTVGNVAGPLLGYEVLTAFFLEATFLGIMLFGRRRVPPKIHVVATCLVAVGTTLSAFWILALNSWMHTPQGHELRDGVVHVVNWWAVIFNPSFPYRLIHTLLASALTSAFLVAGLSAYRELRGDDSRGNKAALRAATLVAAFLVPLQIFVGDLHGLNTFKHQPAKIAAMEAVWDTTRCAPLLLFGYPDPVRRANRFAIEIPCGASLFLTHEANGEVRGINDFVNEAPPVAPVFYAFRVMVGTGVLMLVTAWASIWQLWRRGTLTLFVQRALVVMTFSGWLATLAGWYVTEIGRQPYLVSGLLRTADAVAAIPQAALGISLTLYLTLYVFLIGAFVSTLFFLARRAAAPAAEPVSDSTMATAR